HAGGSSVPDLRPAASASGEGFEAAWSESTAALIKQLLRRSIAHRTTVEARFQERERDYEIRVTAQGPERGVAIVRAVLRGSPDDAVDATGERPRPELDRRGFLRRFKESMSVAALREKSLAIAVLFIDGIPDIAQIIAARVSEQIMSVAILRLSAQASEDAVRQPTWYLGQLGEGVLAVVMNTSDRDAIGTCVSRVCASLREPIAVGDSEFRLTPYAGVGVLGLDASSPKALLDHARAAAAEARRAASNAVFFYSDTIQLRSLERLDLARELREAIANRDIRFRYVGRHDLRTGRLVAWMGYLRWEHPLRGEIRPSEFLRIAESTGLAVALSRAALKSLCEDYATLSGQWDPDVRISFGALRDHIFHEDFLADMEHVLAEAAIPAERLELRIAEKAFVARSPGDFNSLQKRAVQIVVDEAGRGMGSLSSLARAPLWGLQLDRSWITGLRTDEVARKVCRACVSIATALGLTAIATGVDDQAQRDALLEMGYRYGSGDLYLPRQSNITETRHRSGAA
ncbi:MAG TPA: GGDEF domain-containing phosphodiesterase, partial [Steroidobacteraceae bacterium]|nr:GGDEF domain-containing phosphodiesterase [Steroidobacteraceae bacterium]